MFQRLIKLGSAFADYTVGTAMVLTQLALADRGQQRRAAARPDNDPATRLNAAPGPIGTQKSRSR